MPTVAAVIRRIAASCAGVTLCLALADSTGQAIARAEARDLLASAIANTRGSYVVCQGDGTTWLPGGWDHRGALLRMLVIGVGVNLAGSGALAVGRSFEGEGVGGGGRPVDG